MLCPIWERSFVIVEMVAAALMSQSQIFVADVVCWLRDSGAKMTVQHRPGSNPTNGQSLHLFLLCV